MQLPKEQNQKIPEAIILALASAGAYLFSFYYEKGYVSVFKLPVSFIEINLSSILTFGVIIIGVLLFIIPLVNLLLMITLSLFRPVLQRTLLPVILIVVLLLIQMVLYGIQNWKQWLPYVIILIIIAFFQFIFPLLIQKGGDYSEKLSAQEETEKQMPDAFVIIRKKFGDISLVIILVLLLGVSIAENAGKALAIKQRDFLVTNTNPEMVVLRVYGDDLICAPFNRITKEVETSFTILKVTGDSDLVLKLENIGPLHLHVNAIAEQTPEIPNDGTPIIIPTNIFP